MDEIPNGSVPDDLLDIMKRCWDGVPEKRPTFQGIVKIVGASYQQGAHHHFKLP